MDGVNRATHSSVEVFYPYGKTSCEISDMMAPRIGHAMAGLTVCGNSMKEEMQDSCETLNNKGTWQDSYKMNQKRVGHGMWQMSDKVDIFPFMPTNSMVAKSC